ncbi:MAG: acetylglutamate kinase [Deltaproteobacteria bacterium]|jgi:acetylglutamate kinase|nr:acetylglutamate kinase [Deltaproteobacteria bacterium]
MNFADKPWIIIKLGGSSLQDEEMIRQIAFSIKKVLELNFKIALIHGGGPAINEALLEKKMTWEFIEGQRKTTPEMMQVIEATLFGKVNRKIQRLFSEFDVPILGLSGTDLKLLKCEPMSSELGYVGRVQNVNVSFLKQIVERNDQKIVPLIAPIGVNDQGERFNINADMAAMHLAVGLKAKNLVYLTDQKGILDDQKKLINQIDSLGLYQLMETKVVQGGMLVKVRSVVQALRENVSEVDIMSAKDSENLVALLQENKSVGTRCYRI